jgi:hypothetical protein
MKQDADALVVVSGDLNDGPGLSLFSKYLVFQYMEFFVRENEVTFNAIFFSLVSVG